MSATSRECYGWQSGAEGSRTLDLLNAMSRSMCEGQRKQPKTSELPGLRARLCRPFSVLFRRLFTDSTRTVAHGPCGRREGAAGARVIGRPAVLDGELVCLDADGRSDFDALFYRRTDLYFYAFDFLVLDGRDLRERPLLERKATLRRLLGRRRGRVRYLTHVRRRGIALFRAVCAEDLEEIVAKVAGSSYGANGEPAWWRIKNPNYSGALGRWERFERGRRQ
jgi:hypothetical protein